MQYLDLTIPSQHDKLSPNKHHKFETIRTSFCNIFVLMIKMLRTQTRSPVTFEMPRVVLLINGSAWNDMLLANSKKCILFGGIVAESSSTQLNSTELELNVHRTGIPACKLRLLLVVPTDNRHGGRCSCFVPFRSFNASENQLSRRFQLVQLCNGLILCNCARCVCMLCVSIYWTTASMTASN